MQTQSTVPTLSHRRNGIAKIRPGVQESKFLVLGTCVYIVTWYLQLGLRIPILGAIRFEFFLGSFLSVFAILKLLQEPTASPLKKPVLLFLSVLVFYTIFSYDRSQSWDIFYNRVLKFSMLAAFLAAFVRTEWALKMIVGAFLLAMLKLGQEGFVGWYSGGMIWQNQGIPRLHGVTPLYRHPNSYSGMAVGCLPFIFYLFPVVKKWQQTCLAVLFIFCLIIIIYTGSRTGYVATALLGLYFWREKLTRGKIKYFLMGATLIFITFIMLPEEYIGRIISIFTLKEAEGSSSQARLQIIKDSFSVFFSNPWGVGVAAFPSVRIEMFNRFQDTHNLYLEILTNLSLPGLIAFFSMVYATIKTNKILINKNTSNKFVTALSRAIIAFLYARLFLGMFGMDTYEIYWWLAIGLTIATWRVSNSLNSQNPNIPKPIQEVPALSRFDL